MKSLVQDTMRAIDASRGFEPGAASQHRGTPPLPNRPSSTATIQPKCKASPTGAQERAPWGGLLRRTLISAEDPDADPFAVEAETTAGLVGGSGAIPVEGRPWRRGGSKAGPSSASDTGIASNVHGPGEKKKSAAVDKGAVHKLPDPTQTKASKKKGSGTVDVAGKKELHSSRANGCEREEKTLSPAVANKICSTSRLEEILLQSKARKTQAAVAKAHQTSRGEGLGTDGKQASKHVRKSVQGPLSNAASHKQAQVRSRPWHESGL